MDLNAHLLPEVKAAMNKAGAAVDAMIEQLLGVLIGVQRIPDGSGTLGNLLSRIDMVPKAR